MENLQPDSQKAGTDLDSPAHISTPYSALWDIPAIMRECHDMLGPGFGVGEILVICVIDISVDRYEAMTFRDYMRHSFKRTLSDLVNCNSFSGIEATQTISETEIDHLGDLETKLVDFIVKIFETLESTGYKFQTDLHLLLRLEGVATTREILFRVFTLNELHEAAFLALWRDAIAALSPSGNGIQLVKPASNTHAGYPALQPTKDPLPLDPIALPCPTFTPLTVSDTRKDKYCWASMFEAAKIISNPAFVRKELPIYPAGLKTDFKTPCEISAVKRVVRYKGGIILLGFETALIPVKGSDATDRVGTFQRWHFICTPNKQVTCATADVFRDFSLNLKMLEDVPGIAIVSFSANAVMLLGSNSISKLAGWSRLNPVESHQYTVNHSLDIVMQLRAPVIFSVGGNYGQTMANLPARVAFHAQRTHTQILNQASRKFFILYEDENKQSWLVRDIYSLLNGVQLYLKINEYVLDKKPSYSITTECCQLPIPRPVASNPQSALIPNDSHSKANGELSITTHDIIEDIWFSIIEGEEIYRNPASQELLHSGISSRGVELYDLAGGTELRLKKVPIRGSMHAWTHLASFIPVIFCYGIGDLIRPRSPSERDVCGGKGPHPRGVLTCLTEDPQEACKISDQHLDPFENTWKFWGCFEWNFHENPFGPCSHVDAEEPRWTCWSSERFQDISKTSGAAGVVTSTAKKLDNITMIRADGNPATQVLPKTVIIPPTSAVRFEAQGR